MFIYRCLSFYSLAKSPKGGNVADGVVESLLSLEEMLHEVEDHNEDNERLSSDVLEVSVDHASYTVERSDARLVYYVAGYVARKRVLRSNCDDCKNACLASKENVPGNLPAQASKLWDLGGLLYPSNSFYNLILSLENKITRFLSTSRLHAKSAVEMMKGIGETQQIGCAKHAAFLTKSVVRFYCLTRVHFFF